MKIPNRSALTALSPQNQPRPSDPPQWPDSYTPGCQDPTPSSFPWVRAAVGTVLVAGTVLTTMTPMPTLAAGSVAQPTRVSKVLQEPQVLRTLQQFPKEFQNQVRNLSDSQLQVLYGGVSGTTQIGPLTVNHRQAFIKGSFLGKSVWSNVHQNISDAQSKYKMISSGEARALHKVVDQASRFTPAQRTVLADLLMRAQNAH